MSSEDAPSGEVMDSSYASGSQGNKDVNPVVSDESGYDDPIKSKGREDTDEQLQADDEQAIDKSNIMDSRTRGAKPTGQGYSEGPDEDDLPEQVNETGKSSTA